MSSPEEIVEYQAWIADEALVLLTEENRILKEGRQQDNDFLERKRDLLARLEVAVENVASLNQQGISLGEAGNKLIDSAQNRIMKVLMLDKENERLMREGGATPQQAKPASPTPEQPAANPASESQERLKAAYQRMLHRAPSPQQEIKPRKPGQRGVNW